MARRLVRIKSNIGPEGGGFEYQLRQCLLSQDDGREPVVAQTADWGVALDGTARELLAVEMPRKRGEPVLKSAMEFLAKLLADGPKAVTAIRETTKQAGICSWRTMQTAKGKLGVESAHDEAFEGGWFWSLAKTPLGPVDD